MNTVANTQYGTQHAIDFMTGDGCDANGRDITDYWNFDANKWEDCHDHIQWAFPSDIGSQFNLNAPVVDLKKYVKGLQAQGRWNQETMLNHYLISLGFDSFKIASPAMGTVTPFVRFGVWLQPCDHNYRRITRVLNLMHYFDKKLGDELLQKFLKVADFANAVIPNCIDDQTVLYWRLANAGALTRYV